MTSPFTKQCQHLCWLNLIFIIVWTILNSSDDSNGRIIHFSIMIWAGWLWWEVCSHCLAPSLGTRQEPRVFLWSPLQIERQGTPIQAVSLGRIISGSTTHFRGGQSQTLRRDRSFWKDRFKRRLLQRYVIIIHGDLIHKKVSRKWG